MSTKIPNEIFVIDTETSGLDGHPTDLIFEISIVKLNLKTNHIKKMYDKVIYYDTDKWSYYLRDAWIFSNSTLSIELIKQGTPLPQVVKEVRAVLKDKIITTYNIDYDLRKFLYKDPWKLRNVILGETDCIMLSATDYCKIDGYYGGYKWPRLEEAYDILIPFEEKMEGMEFHRALADTWMSAQLFSKMISLGLSINIYKFKTGKE